MSDKYTSLIDYDFLSAQEITVTQAPKCPWQFFITHPDLREKLVWYPSTGTLVIEGFPPTTHYDIDDEQLLEKVYQLINQ